ncbi:MAG: ribosome-associated translation inhibitor RaiA [Proteobacteria bacterium]|jgi:ribosomal subunit interface protein|nr:ribosome-associated translation inhibitor RaiA [Pseudomonadota bacterium]
MKNLTIICKDFELTDAIRNYLEDKMSYLYRYIKAEEESISFNCRLGKVANSRVNGKIYYAEVSIHTPEKNYGGRVEAEDTYIAIDLLKDELSGNITHYKDRTRTLHKKDAQKFKEELHSLGE